MSESVVVKVDFHQGLVLSLLLFVMVMKALSIGDADRFWQSSCYMEII